MTTDALSNALTRETAASATEGDGKHTTPARARGIITALLQQCDKDTARTREDAHLAVSELISNAIRHGGGLTWFQADLSPDRSRLRLQVEDADPRPPRSLHRPDRVTPGGRGWAIVRRLASTCEVALLPGSGKRITVTFAL